MIRFEDYPMPAANLGEENPMPDIKNVSYIHAGYECTDKLTEEEMRYIGKGMLRTMLPYKTQDGYDRARNERVFKAAVLENRFLRAVFLPEIGGRLWSLYDKTLGKELLFKNPVYQPCNLGLRNAWFAGGVEFNVGIKGHNPLTCSPLFCEVAQTPEGEVLNLYEYERIRGVVYTVSAWLPEDSDILYLRNRIENTQDSRKHMYWWSNIAVPETPETRVIVPADEAFMCFYQEDHYMLDKTPVPDALGTDVSYPARVGFSHDFFFKIPEKEKKWIASLDGDGEGLLQCSESVLKGRKLFLWGRKNGGRNWNEFLSAPGMAYVEIQAGLAHTQLEHIPMPGKCEWSWVEAYMGAKCDRSAVNGSWRDAIAAVSQCLREKTGDPEKLHFPAEETVISRRIISEGSGWGALEEQLRGEKISRYHTFPLHAGDGETKAWQELLAGSIFPCPDVQHVPGSYCIHPKIAERLKALPEKNWYALLQLGVCEYAAENLEGAKKAWEESLKAAPSAWAYRNLAMLEKNEWGHIGKAEELMDEAMRIGPRCRVLCVEYAMTLLAAEHYEKWLACFDTLPAELKANGRLRLYRAIALMRLKRIEEAAEIINEDFEMVDIKEGELSVSHLWFELYEEIYALRTGKRDPEAAREAYPLPKKLDFRMI